MERLLRLLQLAPQPRPSPAAASLLRLLQFVPRERSPLSGTLLRLPEEIIRMVFDRLDNVEAALLSLTCRTTYRIGNDGDLSEALVRLARATPGKDRLRFFHLLEKDHPEFLYCETCSKIHWWNTKSRTNLKPLEETLEIDCRSSCKQFGLLHDTVELSPFFFTTAGRAPEFKISRAVLLLVLREASRESHGIPISGLLRRFTYKLRDNESVSVDFSLAARSCRDKNGDRHLLVKTEWSLHFDLEKDLSQQCTQVSFRACKHYGFISGVHSTTLGVLETLVNNRYLVAESSVKCESCPTDWQVIVYRPETDWLFPKVTFTAWKDLGTRRVNEGPWDDQIWARQTHGVKSKFKRDAYVFSKTPLDVLWASSDPRVTAP